MKPRVAKRNMPAAMKLRPPLPDDWPMVATSTIEPRLPSIGMAFISTPAAPSDRSSPGGAWSWISPEGICGSSRRAPRKVVVTALLAARGARWGGPVARGKHYPSSPRAKPSRHEGPTGESRWS